MLMIVAHQKGAYKRDAEVPAAWKDCAGNQQGGTNLGQRTCQ